MHDRDIQTPHTRQTHTREKGMSGDIPGLTRVYNSGETMAGQ